MKAYQKAFDSTKEGVVAENKRKGKTAAAIAVIAFLAVLILAEILLRANAFTLGRIYRANKAKHHKAEVLATMDYYETTEQYFALYTMWSENYLRKLEDDPDFAQYELLYSLASCYDYVVSDLSRYERRANGYEYGTEEYDKHVDSIISSLSSSYDSFLKRYQSGVIENDPDSKYSNYHKSCYNEKHTESYNKMYENVRAMISYYFEIPYDEMESFEKLTESKKNIRLLEQAEAIDAKNN